MKQPGPGFFSRLKLGCFAVVFLGFVEGDFFLMDSTMVDQYQTTIWKNSLEVFF